MKRRYTERMLEEDLRRSVLQQAARVVDDLVGDCAHCREFAEFAIQSSGLSLWELLEEVDRASR